MKILAVLSRVPFPLEKGDKLRAFHLLRHLSLDNEIVLFCLNDKSVHPDAVSELMRFCKTVHIHRISWFSIFKGLIRAFLKGLPLQTGYFYNKNAEKKICEIVKYEKPEHVFCQLVRVAGYVENINIPKTLDYQDVFSKGIERRIQISSPFMKLLLRMEYKRLLKYENYVFSKFDNKTIISEPDRELIPHPRKNEIIVVPNGVDTDYFSPLNLKKEYDIVFTGNMAYLPNSLGAEMLAKEILPLLHKANPGINMLFAGINPSSKVISLKSDKIIVTGWVNDIRNCYAKSKVFVAPMLIGTGLQNKLLEAMSMGLPCVTSPLANKALGAEVGTEILVCNSVDEFVKAILLLINDVDLSSKIAEAGRNFVKAKYNWTTQAALLNQTFKSSVAMNH